MDVHLSKEVDTELRNASMVFGFSQENLVERAVSFYLDVIKGQMDLKVEFATWDELSDEALDSFEGNL